MGYMVYVNHPNNKAIIHTDQCFKYIKRKRDVTHNGYWTGPFRDLNEATEFARLTQKKTIDRCAFCF